MSAFAQLQDESQKTQETAGLGGMIGQSLVMQRLFGRLRQSASHLRVVTLEGEAGTGKALAAKTLHGLGPAQAGAFVSCAATRFLSAATQDVLEEARGGTLLLTRFVELTAEQQSRFLDFLEWWEQKASRDAQGVFPRQIFVSSVKPLRQLSANGELRADLCYRLTAIRFDLPPLRERRDDIPALAEWFAMQHGTLQGKVIRGLGPGALARLMPHEWPGNVRELEMVMANAAMECAGQWIRPIDILPLRQAATAPTALVAAPAVDDDPNLDRMIARHIMVVLARTRGNKLRAAQLLGISRSTLYRLLEADHPVVAK